MKNMDKRREQLAAELTKLGRESGDARFKRAAGILRGAQAGRPAADDDAPLRFALNLLANGAEKSMNAAAWYAADCYALGPTERAKMQRRLRRKLSNTINGQNDK